MEQFVEWMQMRGRTEETAALYALHVRKALEHPRGYLGRLMDRKLAPKTRRTILASLRAYAIFKEDDKLTRALRDVKLPPPMRVEAKTPLSEQEWIDLIREVHNASYISEPMRAVLGLITLRGFRVGDVCRLYKHEVERALETGTLSFEAKGGRRLEYRAKPFMGYLRRLALLKHWNQVWDLLSASEKHLKKQAIANVEEALRVVAGRAGLNAAEVHPHRLRRTYAVQYLKSLKSDPEGLTKLKAQMQWADLSTTASYVDHSQTKALDDAEDEMFKELAKKDKGR